MAFKIAGVNDDGSLTPRAMEKIAADRDVAIAAALENVNVDGSVIRYIGATQPDTVDWEVDDLWLDTSTES